MSALSALRVKSAEKYPGYELDLEDGQGPVQLKSIMDLDKDEITLFSASQKRLTASDENEDLEGSREEFISLLAGVSSDKARVAAALEGEALGVLMVLFDEYRDSISPDASKSPSAE